MMYSEGLRNSVINTVNNCGITKLKAACQFGVFKQLVCAWIKIKVCRGTLETNPDLVNQEKLLKGIIVSYVRCQKVMLVLLH